MRFTMSGAVLSLAALALAAAPGCGGEPAQPTPEREEEAMSFDLTSPAFDAGGAIPVRFTCDGEDLSPELRWEEPPEGTRALALIADDPDAPMKTWVHWVVYDLPASLRALPEGVPADREPAGLSGAKQGTNDFGRVGHGGPCPPPGKPHRYFFKLYALDAALGLEPGATKADVERAMEGHVLGRAELMGTYARRM